MTNAQRQWIDNATYKELLKLWRFAESGSEWFQGDTGKHFAEVMQKRRVEAGHDGATQASREIGWTP